MQELHDERLADAGVRLLLKRDDLISPDVPGNKWRKLKYNDPAVIARLRQAFGDFYLVPEGGSNGLGVHGCAEIPAEIPGDFNIICCPCGTGGTLGGIALGLRPRQQAIGFSVLRDGGFLTDEVVRLQREAAGSDAGCWGIELDYHFGGYARTTPELMSFIGDFQRRHGLLLDRVYVAKMMYGIMDLSRKGIFTSGSTVIAVITG